MRQEIAFLILLLACSSSFAKKSDINIWHGVKSMRGEIVQMEIYEPENPNGTAVIICPGGSYFHLDVLSEGYTTARYFSSKGVRAFVLWYRVAKNNYHYPAMMQDVQRAIQLVRENADKYNIDKNKVGLIGFSAGGHLVTWAAAFAERSNELEKMGIKTDVSLRPDFVIPVYPVVSMQDDICHKKSRWSLLKSKPSQEKKDLFSMEKQIPDNMPPTYLVACKDDPIVKYENSVRLSEALKAKNIDYKFTLYDWGGHGFAMKNNKFMKTFHWNEPLYEWLKERGFMGEQEQTQKSEEAESK